MPVAEWTYEKRRERTAELQRQQRQASQEIGPIPAVAKPRRRRKAVKSYSFFCETYFPQAFTLPWSPYHRKAASKIERAVLSGGLFAFAMPRGSGKTTMCEWAALWSVLSGHCGYVVLVGATEKAAEKRLRSIKTELQTNEMLLDDFPEVCLPIRKLERSVRRADGQKHNAVPTAIEWKKKHVILPTVELQPGEADVGKRSRQAQIAPTSGSIIEVLGITGEIRGLNHKREDGSIIRPQLAVCDDPQTRESAKSATQSADREAVISGDVAYLAGPAKPIAVVMPCTVVYQHDLADNMLDREKHPEWQGERTKMVESFPDRMDLWDQYGEIQRNSFKNDGDGSEATEMYAARQAEMDAGAVVSWPERFNQGELSAIQHAMNKMLRDEAAFMAECQNEPVRSAGEEPELSDDFIASKQSGLPHGAVPLAANKITAFVDVQKDLLYYAVAAWEEQFTGQIIDYGAFPDQGTPYFASATVRNTLSGTYPGYGLEGSIYSGLDTLINTLCGRRWQREDGAELGIDRLLIDANWGQSTPVVYRFCTNSPYRSVLLPAHGKYVGASSQPWSEYKPKRGEQIGHHWRLGGSQSNPRLRRVLSDVNYWKSFVHDRLATPLGDHGCLTLFEGGNHRMLAEHLNAEYRVRTKGRGREVDEWKERPDRPDNHLLDCVVGCCVAASIEGVALRGTMTVGQPRQQRRKYKLSDLKRQKQRRK